MVSGSAETQAVTPLDELIFGGPSAYSHIIQMLPVRAETIPPLDDLTFSVERGEYAFKFFDYRYRARVRYGGGRPPHARLFELVDSERARYADFLGEMAKFNVDFAKISLQGAYSDSVPFWLNTWLPPLDAMALYTILCRLRPRLFVEIGSEMSTKFARQAIEAHSLGTRVISIDPEPRNEIDPLVDETVRSSLEDVHLQIFDRLEADDFLFFDGSHRSFQNSDVTVFFLEILPSLKPGVVVHLHDIYLPYDYPAGHKRRLWNEQYLLATALVYGGAALELLFPAWFVTRDAELPPAPTGYCAGARSED